MAVHRLALSMKLLLASSSPYRQQLLNRLRIPFDTASPNIDESVHTGETPTAYVKRLAISKAQTLRTDWPEHWIIGSDQCCVINERIVGKPHTEEKAVEQLQSCSGQKVTFYTGLCLAAPNKSLQALVEPFTVHFRELTLAEIECYVALEQPLDCAGSFKVEGLGINLFDKLDGKDPNALMGLPLISLLEMFRQAGFNPLNLVSTSSSHD